MNFISARMLRGLRGASALRALRSTSRYASTSTSKLIETELSPSGVLTISFHNEKKLNAWTQSLMKQMAAEISAADTRDDVRGVVLTGGGAYYSAGVDLSGLLQPMMPSKLQTQLRDKNQFLFDMFINFSKPIGAAVNGPAIGAAVTTATLTDVLVAGERATFSVPFAKVGLPAEGCSSVTFAEWMGEANAERMLGVEGWVPTAEEARAAGFPIQDIVAGDNAAVVARAHELVEAQIATGGRSVDASEVARRLKVNADESAKLANAVMSPRFLLAMRDFNQRKPSIARFFSVANATLPLWKPADITPVYAA